MYVRLYINLVKGMEDANNILLLTPQKKITNLHAGSWAPAREGFDNLNLLTDVANDVYGSKMNSPIQEGLNVTDSALKNMDFNLDLFTPGATPDATPIARRNLTNEFDKEEINTSFGGVMQFDADMEVEVPRTPATRRRQVYFNQVINDRSRGMCMDEEHCPGFFTIQDLRKVKLSNMFG